MRSDIADDQQPLHISQRGPVRSIRMRIDLCFFNCILLSFPSRSCEAQGKLKDSGSSIKIWTMQSARYRGCCRLKRQTVSTHAAIYNVLQLRRT